MNDEHTLDLPQMALDSLGDIALGNDSTADAYILGWMDGWHKAQAHMERKDMERAVNTRSARCFGLIAESTAACPI